MPARAPWRKPVRWIHWRAMSSRLFAWALTVGLVALTCWPMTWSQGDSFPHSRFPMFSSLRPREMMLTHALGVLPDGRRIPLPPILSAGNRAVLQSEKFVRRGIETDGAAYCAQVAQRVAASDDADFAAVEAVELATSSFDTVGYFDVPAESRAPLGRHVHARCEVRR